MEEEKNSALIYGAGYRGKMNFHSLTNENIHIEAFVDRDAERIKQYCGLPVLTPEMAIVKYALSPFVISIDDKENAEIVYSMLKKRKIDSYLTLEEFFPGILQVNIPNIKCGERATFQIAQQLIRRTKAVAFSFGIGFDFSFELQLVEKYGVEVYAFDPSPEVVKTMSTTELPPQFHYYSYGLSDQDGKKSFYVPSSGQDYSEFYTTWTGNTKTEMQVYRLKTLMDMFKIDYLDILKMDIEGSEFLALPDILMSGVKFKQLCIENHARIFPNSFEKMKELRKLLNQYGYLMASNEIEEQLYISK